jgi:hypothetical protein
LLRWAADLPEDQKRKPPEVPKKRERQAGSVDCSRRRTCSRDHGGIPLHQIGG